MAGTALMQGTPKRDDRLELLDWFDRQFDDWTRLLPFRPSFFGQGSMTGDTLRVDEFREDGKLVVRAELPGIDPDKDVKVTVSGGMLHIHAERRGEETSETKTYVRRELRYGAFDRALPLPAGVTEGDVTATYRDGVLEVMAPVSDKTPTAIPIATS